MQDKYCNEYDLNQDKRKKDEEEWARLTKGIIVDSITEKSDSENQENRNSSEVNNSPAEAVQNHNESTRVLARRIMDQTQWYFIALVPLILAIILSFTISIVPSYETEILNGIIIASIFFIVLHVLMVLILTFLIIITINHMRYYLDRSDLQYIVLLILGLFGITFVCGLIACVLLRNDLGLKKILK